MTRPFAAGLASNQNCLSCLGTVYFLLTHYVNIVLKSVLSLTL